ncbi:hypothetical protein GOODEAATRI_025489 [Goodea atripinnis]|uniref:Uncharacterized protein n=1 Tax=Goodea atripinnis TaxID=208336 RepID=A0ABV0MKP9_9TELE
MLLPAGVNQLELVCSRLPNRQPSKHLTTEIEQEEAAEERTSDPCSKFCIMPDHPQEAYISRDTLTELGVCKCSMGPCPKCRKPNGPLAELQPPKANGPLDCKSASDPCRQPDLQHRLKTNATSSSDSAIPSGLMNHIGTETVKRDPESTTEAFAQHNCPTAPTVWPYNSQQNHRGQMELQEYCLSIDDNPPSSFTSSSLSEVPPKGSYRQNLTMHGPLSPPPGKHYLHP